MRRILTRARDALLAPVAEASLVGRQTQILLSLEYRQMAERGRTLPNFDDVGFRVFSQNDEDGILLYIFSLVGTVDKRLIDVGCGNVRDSNSANLIINHGWDGLLIDGDERAMGAAAQFYRSSPDTRTFPPTLVSTFITAENINEIIRDHGFARDVELLSIDVDGMDYWIWRAIDCITPQVVVVEYHNMIGPTRAITVPYRPDFKASDLEVNRPQMDYGGASLAAFTKPAQAKGYRLVGCNRYCFNAFFVRSDMGVDLLPEVPVESCFVHSLARLGMEQRFGRVSDMEWIEV